VSGAAVVFHRLSVAIVVLALVSTANAAARTDKTTSAHKLVVFVKKNLSPAAEKKLAVLVLVSQTGSAPAGAVATVTQPLTIRLGNRRLYRVRAEINSSCRGTCAATYRISGAANHKLEVVPNCKPRGTGFACARVKILKLY
jgi:hypothetical protein